MPGNELGDGVHNFFMRDNPFQGQQQSQVAEGNWPIVNSSFPGGTGSGEYPFFFTHGSPLVQSGPRPGSANGSDEQPIMNGFVYGNQSHQTRQNVANSDQPHFTSSRGFSFHELQQHGPDHTANASVSSEASASPVSFDLFGGQHQMSHQQSSMPHFLQPRQTGVNDMPQLQQQLMIRKLQEQEIQRQQLNSRQDYSINQAPPPFAKQSSDGQSMLVNATPNSNNFQNPLSAAYDANWLHQGPPSMQDSSNGLAFQLNTGQSPRSANLIQQQFDQSLYGFPVSNSRGLPETQYPQMMADRYLTPQPQLAIASSSSFHGNQSNSLIDRVGIPDESSIFRHDFQSQNNLEVASKQSVNMGMKTGPFHQQVNSLSRNVALQTFSEKQQLSFHPETSGAKPTGHVPSPKNEAALDPEEEKILFGSDDNIWAAFGNVPHMSGEHGKMIGNGGLFDGLPSIQSGSWSALMQSAVAETSSNDAILSERGSMIFHNNDNGHSTRQMSSMHNDRAEKAKSSSENNVRMQSALNSGSFTADSVETANAMVFNQSGRTIHQEPGHGVNTETSYNSVQPLKEDRYHFCGNPLKTPVASQHHNRAEGDTKAMMSGQTGNRIHSSWNDTEAMPPGIDRFNNHDSQRLKQCSQNSQDSPMLGKLSSSGEQNPLISRTNESGHVRSEVFNLASRGVDDASVAHANNTKKTLNASPFVQNNSLFNQWRSAVSPTTSRDSKSSDSLLNQTNKQSQISDKVFIRHEDDTAKREDEKSGRKNNTSDIRYSNLSHHMSHGFRESGSSSTNDPRSPTPAKQKPANQFSNKGSASRKFLYHPMGNVDEHVEAGHKLRQPVAVRATSQQTHFSESNLFGQAASNSMATGKGQSFEFSRDGEVAGKESLNKNPSRLALNLSTSISQATDTSQNMLELLHKVDQTKDNGGMMQIRAPKGNEPSQPPDSKDSYNVRRLQSQSSVSQGFGLHLGPPSQRMQISQDSKGRPSVPFSTVDGSATLENGRSENSLLKVPRDISSGIISGIPSSKSHLHDKSSTKPGIQNSINQFSDPFSANSSRNAQRGSIEARLPDASTNDRQDNLAASDIAEQIGKNDLREENSSSTAPMKKYEGTSQHFAMSGNSQQRDSAKMLFNIWSNVPVHPNGGQRQLVPSQISDSPYRNILESSSTPMQHLEECKSKESFGQQSESVSTDRVPKIDESVEKESSMKKILDKSASHSTSVLKEIEDFGRYLRPNSFSDQTYSLPKQTLAVKDKDRDSKMTDRQDILADVTPVSGKAGDKGSSTAVISGDSNMMSSSETVNIVSRIIPQHGSITSQKDSGLNSSVSQSHTYGDSATFPRVEHHQVSPQMAPTWFSAHGSSKSGQMLQVYNAHELSQVRTGQPPPPEKSAIGSNALNSEDKVTDATPGASVANHHYSSTVPQLKVTADNLVPLQQKKRKIATFGSQPWHKEISDDSRFLGILSMTEPDLSKAANRVDGVAETTEDANPVLRSKRRLIMSSHLMQLLIRPPPPVIPLSIDASTSYDIVAYSVSRIALGDACHAVSYANNLEGSCSSGNLLSEKSKSSTKTRAQGYENSAKELIGKVTKLENDLSRLEKSASLLDLRLECQELEKFTIINRFAKFHGRGQNESSDTSANATVSMQRFPAQKYVIPVAMPRNLPESVNCLQL